MKLKSAVIALLFSSTPAFAADLAPAPVEPLAPIAVFNWTGFYVGTQIGYAWGNSETRAIDTTVPIGEYGKANNDPKGIFGGAHAGYNYQFDGGIVLGAEGDINVSDLHSSYNPVISNGALGPAGQPIIVGFTVKQQWSGSARLRAGYAIDRFLPYITGGVAFGEIKTNLANDIQGIYGSANDTRIGWTAGAGLEYAFTDNVTGRIEYRYTDYGTAKLTMRDSAGSTGRTPTDLSTHAVHTGVSYKL